MCEFKCEYFLRLKYLKPLKERAGNVIEFYSQWASLQTSSISDQTTEANKTTAFLRVQKSKEVKPNLRAPEQNVTWGSTDLPHRVSTESQL